jgi:hypothetical protein
MPNSPRTGLEVGLPGSSCAWAINRPWRDFFLNQFIPEPAAPRPISHQSNHYLRLAERIGAYNDEPLPGLAPVERTLADYARVLSMDRPSGGHILGTSQKRLSEEFGLHWLIFGTSGEQSLGRELAEQLRSAANESYV